MNQIIQVKNLSKTFKKVIKRNFFKDIFKPEFKKVHAVEDISFSIEKGESVAFLGPNGAGKTTTIKMLTGLVYPSSGEIKVLDYTPFDRKQDFLMRIGLVMGNKAGLNWDLTPNQSFELLKGIYKIPDNIFQERIHQLTELLDTKDFLNTQVRKLSLGERMKMEIIGAILHNPEVLFLDEPTIGLDIISKQKIRDFLRSIQKEFGVTMLLTSHDMDDIEKVCDRVIVINKGKKVYDDKLVNLNQKYDQDRYVKFIFSELPDQSVFSNRKIIESGDKYYLFEIQKQDLSSFIGEVTTKYQLLDIEILSTPLEEIIADIFRQ
jgi:ABC-2 type transport system ATP-binding protein